MPNQLFSLLVLFAGSSAAVYNLRLGHYNRGFNQAVALPESLLCGAAITALVFVWARGSVIPTGKCLRSAWIPIWITSINAVLTATLLFCTLFFPHGLWHEHVWIYDHVSYRSYGFLPWSSVLMIWMLATTFTAIQAERSRGGSSRIVIHGLPLAATLAILSAHFWIKAPYYKG